MLISDTCLLVHRIFADYVEHIFRTRGCIYFWLLLECQFLLEYLNVLIATASFKGLLKCLKAKIKASVSCFLESYFCHEKRRANSPVICNHLCAPCRISRMSHLLAAAVTQRLRPSARPVRCNASLESASIWSGGVMETPTARTAATRLIAVCTAQLHLIDDLSNMY